MSDIINIVSSPLRSDYRMKGRRSLCSVWVNMAWHPAKLQEWGEISGMLDCSSSTTRQSGILGALRAICSFRRPLCLLPEPYSPIIYFSGIMKFLDLFRSSPLKVIKKQKSFKWNLIYCLSPLKIVTVRETFIHFRILLCKTEKHQIYL